MHLGIDVGTISVKIVCLDDGGGIVKTLGPARHEGLPAKALVALLKELALEEVTSAVATGAGRKWVSKALGIPALNVQRTLARAVARLHPDVRTIIEIGGRDSQLIVMKELQPGEEPVAIDASRSSMCAAGTGSFLDQQAKRLGFTPEELGSVAMTSDSPANVSGRCSVFAKTDLIHLQQIGTRDNDMLAGLCYAVVRTFRSSVAKGRKIERPVVLCGGVALNECVRRAVKEVFELGDDQFILPERPDFMAAHGAAIIAGEGEQKEHAVTAEGVDAIESVARDAATARRLPTLGKPSHPASTERKIHPLPEGKKTEVYLGLDIGSISTKAAVVTADGTIVARRYFWTAGRPMEAVRRAMKEIGEELGDKAEVIGVGTTGSGRYLVGDFIGADVIKNEITAQATAAIIFDPKVDTVFEIGGQDSKFIVIRDGTVVDFEMNKVCAAGTGSFLNEQADRMKLDIEKQFSDLAFSSAEPIDCGERCTVFMDTDVSNYLASGASRQDLSAGLAYSIAKNYLSKVADRAKIGKRILFQGAVAYNDAVVAAFEKETGKEIRVTPNTEITGCIGVALIARDEKVQKSKFRGFKEVAERDYVQSVFTCKLCDNRCDVRKVAIEGRPPLFYGDRCDRYQTEKKTLGDDLPDLFEERTSWLMADYVPEPESGPLVGIPRAMAMWDLLPYWRTFLRELGARTVLSGPTTRSLLDSAADTITTESCMPVKAAHGHVLDLIDKKCDFIFLPTLVDRERPKDEQTFRYNCPFVQVWGHVARAGIDLDGEGPKALDPVIFPSMGERLLLKELDKLADDLGLPKEGIAPAIKKAEEAQAKFVKKAVERGREILADMPGGRGIVVLGRPYNTGDPGLNLDVPKKLRKMGVLPIPQDFMPVEQVDILSLFENMFWHYGRIILAAAVLAGKDDRLDVLYISNFRCGPDSFLVKLMADAMKGKPYLFLEFDDHAADAGVVTRIEAYLDSRRSRSRGEYAPPDRSGLDRTPRKRTVYMPHMGDMLYGIAAAARAYGIDMRVIDTNRESLDAGLAYTSGKECLPYTLCVGNIVKTVARPDFDRKNSAFFMTSSAGPCRLGQYEHGIRRVLDDLGYPDIDIVSMHQSKGHLTQHVSIGFTLHCYRGLVAIAKLEELTRQIRPFEAVPGTTDRVYAESLKKICDVLESKKKPYRALREAAKRFTEIETLDLDKPRILVVGENYVRNQPFSNSFIDRKIEALGGIASIPTFVEWVHHVHLGMKLFAREKGGLIKRFGMVLLRGVMGRIENRVARALGPAWRYRDTPHVETLWKNSERSGFVSFFGDASLAVGLAIDMAERGLIDGIVNVMPFTCMPQAISRSQLRRAAPLLDGLPVLDIEFDGRGDDQVREEVEMFMDQVNERRRIRRADVRKPEPAATL